MRVWSFSRAAVLLLVVAGCAGCRDLRDASQQAQTLDGGLHASITRGDWNGIYTGADDGYRQAITEEKSKALFSAIQRKLGNPVSFKLTGWRLNTTTSGTILYTECATTFSDSASGKETIVWRKGGDGQYHLYGYNISSEELITR